ncbi:MAG: mechanosensitive ion channel [Eubacteriales bacterium]|nr:mechanosensitive ion channel [Eubacteriales bacterium]
MENAITNYKEIITSILYEYIGKKGVGIIDFAFDILISLLILFIGFKLVEVIVKTCRRIFERSNLDPTLQTFLLSFIRLGMKVLIIFWAITKIGVGASSIIAILGSAGLALGLSLQGSLTNIAGGVILLFMKPFQVGDYILDGSGKEGTVQSIGIMYTKLLSIDNKAIMIPNGELSNATVTNFTFQNKRRVDLLIGISYNDDIRKAKEVLNAMILEEEALLPEEPIEIYVNDYKDSSIELGLRYWVSTENYWTSRWRVLEEIKYAFDANGISIPFNQMDVNVVSSH